MADIVDRLRGTADITPGQRYTRLNEACRSMLREAADEIERLQRENAELTALFEQRWNTDLRAKKRWQDAHPDQPNTWPSRDDLLVWLMAELSTARRTALLEAAGYHDDLAAQHDACEYESDYHLMMARSHRTFAAAIRKLAEEA